MAPAVMTATAASEDSRPVLLFWQPSHLSQQTPRNSPAFPHPTRNMRAFCCTWHIRRAVLLIRAVDAQLAAVVITPAFDATPGHDRARVLIPRGDGDGGHAWKRKEEEDHLD